MTKPTESTPLNEAMRRAFRAGRFSVDGQGRLLRGPDDDAETASETEAAEGASRLPADPTDAMNALIRRRLTGQG